MIVGNMKALELSGLPAALLQVLTDSRCTLDALNQSDDGRIESGDGSWFCNLGDSTTQDRSVRHTEWHKEYADIQLVLSGEEIIHYSCEDASALPSEEKKPDLFILEQPVVEQQVHLKPGYFAVFFPGEPHQALCRAGNEDAIVRKAVFKINRSMLGGLIE